jgi:hypothetical protein
MIGGKLGSRVLYKDVESEPFFFNIVLYKLQWKLKLRASVKWYLKRDLLDFYVSEMNSMHYEICYLCCIIS